MICRPDFILVDYANQESVERDVDLASPLSLNALTPFLFFSFWPALEKKKDFEVKVKKSILGDRDSNPGFVVQSHTSCRWTIPQ